MSETIIEQAPINPDQNLNQDQLFNPDLFAEQAERDARIAAVHETVFQTLDGSMPEQTLPEPGSMTEIDRQAQTDALTQLKEGAGVPEHLQLKRDWSDGSDKHEAKQTAHKESAVSLLEASLAADVEARAKQEKRAATQAKRAETRANKAEEKRAAEEQAAAIKAERAQQIDEHNSNIDERDAEQSERDAVKGAYISRQRLLRGSINITPEIEAEIAADADQRVAETFGPAKNEYGTVNLEAVKEESREKAEALQQLRNETSNAVKDFHRMASLSVIKVSGKQKELVTKGDITTAPVDRPGSYVLETEEPKVELSPSADPAQAEQQAPAKESRREKVMAWALKKLVEFQNRGVNKNEKPLLRRKAVLAAAAGVLAVGGGYAAYKGFDIGHPKITDASATPPTPKGAPNSELLNNLDGSAMAPRHTGMAHELANTIHEHANHAPEHTEVTIHSGSGNTIYNEATKNLQHQGDPTPTLKEKVAEMHRIMQLNHVTEDEARTLAGAGDVKLKI